MGFAPGGVAFGAPVEGLVTGGTPGAVGPGIVPVRVEVPVPVIAVPALLFPAAPAEPVPAVCDHAPKGSASDATATRILEFVFMADKDRPRFDRHVQEVPSFADQGDATPKGSDARPFDLASLVSGEGTLPGLQNDPAVKIGNFPDIALSARFNGTGCRRLSMFNCNAPRHRCDGDATNQAVESPKFPPP
jgi:hypothetical protein